MITADIGLMLQ